MFVLTAEVKIGGKTFRRIHEVEIEKSSREIGAKATIQLPATARLTRSGAAISEVETAKVFSVGDEVTIRLGYNGTLREEFAGYVSKVKPGIPVEVECLDSVYLLRRKNLKASFKQTTLSKLIEFILDGTGVEIEGEVPGINFEHFYFRNINAAAALQKLKEEYGLTVYFRGNSLKIGLRNEDDETEVKYSFGVNIVESSLEWINEDDVRIKVKVINWNRDNTKKEIEIGDGDGEQRTLYFYNVPNESQLKMLAEAEIGKLKYSGYKGSIETFLWPNVEVANVAQLKDDDYPEREGRYLIDKVNTSFGTGGARRRVELGIKLG